MCRIKDSIDLWIMVIYRKNRYIIITLQLIPKLILQFKKMKKMKNKNSNK